MMSPREGRWKAFDGLWLDGTSYTREYVSAKVLWQKISGDGNKLRKRSELLWCSLGMKRTWSLVLRRNGTVGVPLSVPQAPGIYERQTLNRQRLRYSGEIEKQLFHLMTLKGKERKQMRFQSLLLEGTAFLYLFTFQKEWSVLHNEHLLTVLPDTHTLTYLKMQMVVKFPSGSSDKINVEGIGFVQQDRM